MTKRKAIFAVVIIIITMVIYCVAYAFPSIGLFEDPTTGMKYCLPVKNIFYMTEIVPFIDLAIYTIIPLITIFVVNILIIWKLYAVKSERQENLGSRARNVNDTNQADDSTRKVTIMLLSVSSFFLATTLPFCIFCIGTSNKYALGREGKMGFSTNYKACKKIGPTVFL